MNDVFTEQAYMRVAINFWSSSVQQIKKKNSEFGNHNRNEIIFESTYYKAIMDLQVRSKLGRQSMQSNCQMKFNEKEQQNFSPKQNSLENAKTGTG